MTHAVLAALAVTVLVEAPVVALFYPGQRFRMLVAAALTTAVSNVLMNTLWRGWAPSADVFLVVGEGAAVVVEAAVYAALTRRQGWERALVASVVANSLSYAAGWLW